MYKVLIRVDGGLNTGMGHIMRCISLGKMFLKKGYKVTFVSKYNEGKKVIGQNGFDVISIFEEQKKENIQSKFCYGNPIDLEIEKHQLINILKNEKADILIIDNYNITKDFFLYLKPYVNMLIYIDDMNSFDYPVDVVINGNITGLYMNYQPYFKYQKFLVGTKYNLIRDEFQELPKRIVNKKIRKVLITTGGSDPYRVTEKLIDIIRNEDLFNDIEIHTVIGSGFQNKNEIKEKQKKCKNIVLYENAEKMSSIMLECDIALSSCGSTLYELCACGVPTLGFILADNQVFIAKKMDQLGYIKNLGWYNQLNTDNVIYGINQLLNDFEIRKNIVKKQQTLVDGKGTDRIVSTITKIMIDK